MKARGLGSGNRFANVTSVVALFIALGGTTVYAANTIGADDIQRNAVRSKHIKSGNVKRSDLAAGAVNAPKIADGAVTPAKLNVKAQWSTVPLNPAWQTFISGSITFGAFQCFKDPFGLVHLRGAVERKSSEATSEVVGVLPPACRVITSNTADLYAEFLTTRMGAGGGGEGAHAVFVDSSGSVVLETGPFAPGEGVAFDGLTIASR